MRLCNFVPYGNNFGDELGPAVALRILQEYFDCANSSAIPVVNLALGHPVRRVPEEPCLFTVGSIFHFIRPGDHVWGTGINPFRTRKEMYATDIVVHSVRGPLSLEWLLDKRSSFIWRRK
jgi:pyruvyltransferase